MGPNTARLFKWQKLFILLLLENEDVRVCLVLRYCLVNSSQLHAIYSI